MPTHSQPQVTDFTRDVLGRFICNGLDEALRSTDTNARPDAKPFDMIVIGGGTFAGTLAQHLFFADSNKEHRILVLEGGPFLMTEHVQNLPMIGLNVPGATSIQALRQSGQYGLDKPMNEVWGLPWHSSTPFPGLAFCVGGRSLYWGGWAPRLLGTETPVAPPAKNPWPASTVNDLNSRYFQESSDQIGVTDTNDFIYGDLHHALRRQLLDGLKGGNVTDAVDLATLPPHPAIPPGTTPPDADLLALLGLPSTTNLPTADLMDLLKLEAPLAVQTHTRPGFFPINKFSAAPLLIKAARAAWQESGNDDVKRRLMVVPQCHVQRLLTDNGLVTGIQTSQGFIAVPTNGKVFLGLGTIENTRLALNSFQGIANYGLIGGNLMAHLRSNLIIRIPRSALASLDPQLKDLQASALFVKGRHIFPDGSFGHFHIQITAAGLGSMGTDSEAQLFKKVPDIDGFEQFKNPTETHVVITLRGIGEMESLNPGNLVRLDSEPDEFGASRAFVQLAPTAKDQELWNAMDKAANDLAKVFAGGQTLEILTPANAVRDGLGTTHHETGTLWMGDNPAKSVTNPFGRFHGVDNAYALGPCLHPSIGSPNPTLTGVALARRLGNQLSTPDVSTNGLPLMFDGVSLKNWRMAGGGAFGIVDHTLRSYPGSELGLLWCTTPLPPDFILTLEWMRSREDDNSGVFVRFPDPTSKGYQNQAWVGVDFGFEIQIDEQGRPDGAPQHKTGAIYGQVNQNFSLKPALPVGQWNTFEIQALGQTYTVFLNGTQVTQFQNTDSNRGLASTSAAPSFFGLQSHTGRVSFRNIQVQPNSGTSVPAPQASAASVKAGQKGSKKGR